METSALFVLTRAANLKGKTMANDFDMCVVVRTYGGQEGDRVKAGTRLSIDKKRDGMITISRARYRQLESSKIVQPWKGEAPAAPGASPLVEKPNAKAERKSTIRAIARARTSAKQQAEPIDPQPLTNARRGSQTGAAKPAQSSLGDQAQKPSTSKLRGNRRSAGGSALTTPTNSRPGSTRSTDAMGAGGEQTAESQSSPA